jgi:glycolate oxidase FAD binding subunit
MERNAAVRIDPLPRLAEGLREALERPAVGPSLAPPAVRLRLGTVPTQVGVLLLALEERLTGLHLERAIAADFGSGQVRISLDEPQAGQVEKLAGMIQELRERLAAYRGFVVVEAAPLVLKERVTAWGDMGGELRLMRRIKARFDPHQVLNPGRFLGPSAPGEG